MATTTPSAALVRVAPVFTNTERLALAGFFAAWERLSRQRGRFAPRAPALRPSHSRTRIHPTTRHRSQAHRRIEAQLHEHPQDLLTTKRLRYAR
jgi:hypothetical protein